MPKLEFPASTPNVGFLSGCSWTEGIYQLGDDACSRQLKDEKRTAKY